MGRAFQNRKESMAKTSDAKAKLYSKYGREIYVCAKAGGVEPDGNLSLRSLIDRAKKDQVPGHVIEKALDKAKGSGGEDFAAARYEGFGPGGTMVIVECLTDNPNRTFGDVRTCFNKAKCKIGGQGSVVHTFAHIALDWTHLEGVNFIWPVLDRFFALEGEMYLSASEGFVQTFVDVGRDPETGRSVIDAGQGGTRAETHVSNPAQPDPEPDPGPVDRRFPIAVRGWQLHLLLTGVFVVFARRLQSDRLTRCGDGSDSVSDD